MGGGGLLFNLATFIPCAFTGRLLAWAISAVLNAVAVIVFVHVVERRYGQK
jgi:hypothetical protein